MKSLKIVFASLLLAVGAIGVSSFTVKNFKNDAFAIKCYAYQIDVTNEINRADIDFVQFDEFKVPGNWLDINASSPTAQQCPDGSKVCVICFNDSQLGLVTFTELLEDIHAYLASLSTPPAHGTSANINATGALGNSTVNVTFYRKTND